MLLNDCFDNTVRTKLGKVMEKVTIESHKILKSLKGTNPVK